MIKNKRIMITIACILVFSITIVGAYITGVNERVDFYDNDKGQSTEDSQDIDKQGTQDMNDNGEGTITRSEEDQPDDNNDEQNEDNEQQNATNDGEQQSQVKVKPVKAKAIYLTGISAGDKKKLDHVIELTKTTELNAVVIDVKEAGIVNYKSEVPQVVEYKLYRTYYNVDEVIKKLHENNVYVIGRIVCFKDNELVKKRADLAIKMPDGRVWRENGRTAWTNPYNEEVWRYNIDIAKEAADKGFDEIQFDYVRFPAAKSKDVDYGENVPSKVDAICNFLELADHELEDEKGTFISADVFGIICESVYDGKALGQDLEQIGRYIDYICPMVYPSHYANASNGVMGNGYGQSINGVMFTAPDLKPYEVVYNTLLKAKDRISKTEAYKAVVRPYLQDFTASYIKNKNYYQVYGAEQVRQQIKAVYDAGYEEWILWNGGNIYSEEALEKKGD